MNQSIVNQQQKKNKDAAQGKNASQSTNVAKHPLASLQQLLGNHGVLNRYPGVVQAKLVIGQPDDQYEREADRVAEQVMRMRTLQRPCATCAARGSSCLKCGGDEQELVRRKTLSASAATGLAVPEGLGQHPGTGQPLDRATRAFFEPRFGYDFSHVRVHTDARAAESARAMNALAYTVGRDIYFASGQSPSNGELIAHELTHVVQQRQKVPMASPIKHQTLESEPAEQGARSVSEAPANGQSIPTISEELSPSTVACYRTEEDYEKLDTQVKPLLPEPVGEYEVHTELKNRLNRNKGGGSPISDQTRAFFEPRLQFDFSKVRVHTNTEAARMNQELGARAFTYGQDIYFGVGQYNPQSTEGNRLMAHELTHVAQQSNTGAASAQNGRQFHNISKARNETIQRYIEPYPGTSGDFIITVNDPSIGTEAEFIRQVRRDLGSKVRRSRVREDRPESDLMRIDRFDERLRICWSSELSLRPPNSRQIIVRLEGWGSRVSRFILISPQVSLPSPEESRKSRQATLPPLHPPQQPSSPPITGGGLQRSLTVSLGVFRLDMRRFQNGRMAGLRGTVNFRPDPTGPRSDRIGLIQAVQTIDQAGVTAPAGEPVDMTRIRSAWPEEARALVTTGEFGEEPGWSIDVYASHFPQGTSIAPTYIQQWGQSHRENRYGWVRSPTDFSEASYYDAPQTFFASDWQFEVEAVGMDNGQRYGSIRWIFRLRERNARDARMQVEGENAWPLQSESPEFSASMVRYYPYYLHEPVWIPFGRNESGVARSDWDQIQEIADYMNRYTDVTAFIRGYAAEEESNTGMLSQYRAEAVEFLLLSSHVSAERIHTIAMGTRGNLGPGRKFQSAIIDFERTIRRGSR